MAARIRNLMGAGAAAALANAIVGATGTVNAINSVQNSLLLPYDNNILVTSGGATAGTLPSIAQGSSIGDSVEVFNSGSGALVYPATGEQINNAGANVPASVASNTRATFKRLTATLWGN